jgi:hypothetical protein
MCDWNAKPSENSLSPPMCTCFSFMSTRRPLNDIEPVTAFLSFEGKLKYSRRISTSRGGSPHGFKLSVWCREEDMSVVDSYIEEFRKVAENYDDLVG